MRQLRTHMGDPDLEERVRRLEQQVASLTATVRSLTHESKRTPTENSAGDDALVSHARDRRGRVPGRLSQLT
jgi:hypothetical protein